MYLFDTNHCSAVFTGNLKIHQRFTDPSLDIATTVITMGELILMAEKSARYDENLKTINGFLASI